MAFVQTCPIALSAAATQPRLLLNSKGPTMAVQNILKRDPVAAARKAHEAAARALANAQTRRAAAQTEVEAAEQAQTVAATADGEAADGVLETATRRLRDARDMLDAFDRRVIPAAEAALSEAETQMADAQRQAQYAAAEAQAKAARSRLVKEYPDLQRRYAELLALVTEADAAIEAANANLPAGQHPLDTVESAIRDHPAQPRRIVSDTVQPIWHHLSGDRVLDPARVVNGRYQHKDGGAVHHLGSNQCKRIDLRVVVAIPPRPGVAGPRLADTPLPPLTIDAPADRPAVTEYLQPETIQQGKAA